MAFGKNYVELIGRLGRDVEIHELRGGGRVANLSVATDEGYRDKRTGEWVDNVEWHRCVTFQEGLIERLEQQGTKGRLVLVEGKLQTRTFTTNGGEERSATEILIVPGHRVQFLDKPNGANGNGSAQPASAPESAPAMPSGGSTAPADDFDDDIPF